MLSLKNDFYVAFVKFHVKSQSVGVVVLAALTAFFVVGSSAFFFIYSLFSIPFLFLFILIRP